jgi:hypothetical protein
MGREEVSAHRVDVRRLGRLALVGIVSCNVVTAPPAHARQGGGPPVAQKASERACDALRQRIDEAWGAGAYQSMEDPDPVVVRYFAGNPDPEKAAGFPALWEDYLERCPCEMIDRERYGYRGQVLTLIHYLPPRERALYEEALRHCGGPWWAKPLPVATAVAAAGGTVLALSGGSSGADRAAASSATSSAPPPPPAFSPDGTFACTTQVAGGDRRHVSFIGLAGALQLALRSQGGVLTVAGQPGDNFVSVTGPFDLGSRSGNLTGSGPVAGRTGIGVQLELRFVQDDTATGTYVMGIGGGLPGGTTTDYMIECRR